MIDPDKYVWPIAEFAEAAAIEYDGDIVEIGVGSGHVADDLLKVCVDYHRVMIGIDPFEHCWNDEDLPESYTRPYPKQQCPSLWHTHFVLHQFRSQDPNCKQILKRPLIFAHVDGNQSTVQIILDDLFLVEHAKIIAVDDYALNVEVQEAVHIFLKETKRQTIKTIQRWILIK